MKRSICVVLAGIVVLVGSVLPSQAHVRGGVFIGPGWGPGWWGPYPYPYSYPYASAPIVIREAPQEYIYQAAPQATRQGQGHYWYYCPDAKGYYPQVPKCPKGWLKVVPESTPPRDKE